MARATHITADIEVHEAHFWKHAVVAGIIGGAHIGHLHCRPATIDSYDMRTSGTTGKLHPYPQERLEL